MSNAGQEMQVRAMTDIKEGEQLCVAYVSLTEDRLSRQRDLLETKHFTCGCPRCAEPIQESKDRWLEVIFWATMIKTA